MSTITTALPFDPADPKARYQFAVAVGKPTTITGPMDGQYTVTVEGLGAGNLQTAISGFTVDPAVNLPTPAAPAKTVMDVLAVDSDGNVVAVTPADGTREVLTMAKFNPLRDRTTALETANATLLTTVATLTQRVAALEAGDVIDDALAAAHSTQIATLQGQVAALQVNDSTMSALIAAVQAKTLKGASGEVQITANLLGGTTTDKTVTLDKTMPTGTYITFVCTDGGAGVLATPPSTTVLSKTTTAVSVRVRNNAVATLAGITVRVLALELA